MNEGMMQNIKDKVTDFTANLGTRDYKADGNTLAGLFKQNGWIAYQHAPVDGYNLVVRACKNQNKGLYDNSIDDEELIEDLNIMGQKKGWTAEEVENDEGIYLIGFKKNQGNVRSLGMKALAEMVAKAVNEAIGDEGDFSDMPDDFQDTWENVGYPEPEDYGEEKDIDDPAALSDVLESCGWAYHDFKECPDCVKYVVDKDPGNTRPMEWEQVADALKSVYGDKVQFTTGHNKWAPEKVYNVVKIMTGEAEPINEEIDPRDTAADLERAINMVQDALCGTQWYERSSELLAPLWELWQEINDSYRLNEEPYRESPIYNDNGEIVDTGGWFDPDDYYDPYSPEAEYAAHDSARRAGERFASRVKAGEFDDKLGDDEWREKMEDSYYDGDLENDFGIPAAMRNRRMVIDKDYAMAHGKNPDNYDPDKVAFEKAVPADFNHNINDRSETTSKTTLGQDGWRVNDVEHGWADSHIDRLKKENPADYDRIFKKNGKVRSVGALTRNLSSTVNGLNAADKRPLHRKGSLNREL